MNDILLFILSIIGLLALYWVFIGQGKWNKMLMNKKASSEGEVSLKPQNEETVLSEKQNAKKE